MGSQHVFAYKYESDIDKHMTGLSACAEPDDNLRINEMTNRS